MVLFLGPHKKLRQENGGSGDVYIGSEHRKRGQQAEDAWSQLRGWSVAEEETVKTEKEQKTDRGGARLDRGRQEKEERTVQQALGCVKV